MASSIAGSCDREHPIDRTHAGLVVIGVIVAVTLCAYSVVLTSSFGVLDDYTFLSNAISDNDKNFLLLAMNGRPLNGLLIDLGFRWASSIANLTDLRAIGLIGIALTAGSFFLLGRKQGLSVMSSLVIGCAIILLPSFQIYASWAQHLTTPYAGVMALASVYIATPNTFAYQRSRVAAILLSTALLVAALSIYQPMAMLFCTGSILLVANRSNLTSGELLRVGIVRSIVFAMAMVIAFLIFKWGQSLAANGSARFGLVRDIPGKLVWFFREPVLNGLSVYSVLPNHEAIASVLILSAIGLMAMMIRRGIVDTCVTLVVFVVCLAGSAVPNLLTGENWASYRSLGAFYASIVLIVILLCRETYRLAASHLPKGVLLRAFPVRTVAAGVALIPLVVLAQSHVTRAFVLPNVTELDNVASLLIAWSKNDHPRTTIYLIPSTWTDSYALPQAYDEFGMASSITPLYARELVAVLLRTSHVIPNVTLAEEGAKPPTSAVTDADVLVIDFARMVTSNRMRVFIGS